VPAVALDANSCDFTNNTIVGGNLQVGLVAAKTGFVLRNNLGVNGATFYTRFSGASETAVSNNATQNVTAAYAGGASSAGGDISSGLMLGTDYRPLPGSPLLTSGFDLGYTRDNENRQGRKFIGAYAAARLRSPI
jgi:hypothetical protein